LDTIGNDRQTILSAPKSTRIKLKNDFIFIDLD